MMLQCTFSNVTSSVKVFVRGHVEFEYFSTLDSMPFIFSKHSSQKYFIEIHYKKFFERQNIPLQVASTIKET